MSDHCHDCPQCDGYFECDLDDCNDDDLCLQCQLDNMQKAKEKAEAELANKEKDLRWFKKEAELHELAMQQNKDRMQVLEAEQDRLLAKNNLFFSWLNAYLPICPDPLDKECACPRCKLLTEMGNLISKATEDTSHE